MLNRYRRYLSPKEKTIALILFGVLLPTLLLFYSQFRALSELRDKSKAVFQSDLRQTSFEIEDKTEAKLLEASRDILQDYPNPGPQPWDGAETKKNLAALLEKNAGVESAFVFVVREGTFKAAIDSRTDGYRESETVLTAREAAIYTADGRREEDPLVPFVLALRNAVNRKVDKQFLLAQHRCEYCQEDEQAANGILFLYRMLTETTDYKTSRYVGVRLKQDYLIEEFFAPVIAEEVRNNSANSGVDMVFGIFNEQKRLLYSNDGVDSLDDFEIKTPWSRVFPMWTVAGSFRNNKIENLSNWYFWRGLLLMAFVLVLLALGIKLLFGVMGREVGLAEAKSAFVSNVSHELKTPLALIRLFAETLQSGRAKNPEKVQEYYRIITTESVRLTHLINNILDFSAIEAGRKEYNFSPCDLGETVREVVHNYSYSLENAGFKVETHFQKDLPHPEIDCDAISQVVLNLLNNAAKYSTDEKFIEVNVERQRENIAVEITDHGIGIAPNEQAKIFGNFYRVGGSNDVHNVKGSGLGLALVKHIVEAHGGRVNVSSVLKRGSTFTVLLPIERAANGKGKI